MGVQVVVDGRFSPNRADDLDSMSMKRRVQEKNQKRSGPAPLLKFGGPGAARASACRRPMIVQVRYRGTRVISQFGERRVSRRDAGNQQILYLVELNNDA